MQANQLAEMGSWIALHSANLVFGRRQPAMGAANEYWTASKCRLQRWITAMKMFEADVAMFESGMVKPDDFTPPHDPWPAMEIVVQEILLSEFVTRIWAATVLCHDQYHQTEELHGLAHSTFVSHIEARNRAVRLLLSAQSLNEKAFDRINLLRRKLERWTDLFMAQLPNLAVAKQFAFDADRVTDFYEERRQESGADVARRQHILAASFSAEVHQITSTSANPSFNRQIASGILRCFPSDRFDSTGLPKSARMLWLEKSQDDTEMLVDELLDFEAQSQIRSAGTVA